VKRDSISRNRYRTLRAALIMLSLLALGGAVTLFEMPRIEPLDLATFVGAMVVCLGLLPLARRAAARNDREALERLAVVCVGVGCGVLLQRIVATLYGSFFDDPQVDLFRLQYAAMPLLFLGAVAMLPARRGLRFSWAIWLLVVLAVLPGLYLKTGFDTNRPGLLSLIVFLILVCPAFILLMHVLPNYEEQIDRHKEEVAEMRGRTDLMDALAESERRFNLVVEGLEVGVWDRWVDPQKGRWWSPRFYELLGYAPEELEPNEANLRELMHEDDRETVWKAGSEQLRKGDLLDVDFRFRTKHRGYRWFNSRARAERDAEGKLVRLAGSLTDIHDRRMAEDRLHAAQVELTRLAYRDTLTDLHNRRYFDEHFQREWERARRSRQPLSLLLVDLDHFKSYNDRYGHAAGDSCLVEFSHLLARCANRPADIVARLGGEEFGLVLPETSAVRASRVAQRMQLLLEQAAIPHEGSPRHVLTFSTGIAAIETPDGPGPAELFEQADRALYEVKRRGRNGILRYDELAPGEALFGTKAR